MLGQCFALLDFDPALDIAKKYRLRDGLSGVLQVGNTLWLANDETASLERLSFQKKGTDRYKYGGHVRFSIGDFLRLPVPPSSASTENLEVDLEGLAYVDDFLWLVGSHSQKRKKPEAGKSAEENIERLAKVSRDGNRFLLARIPLVEENGAFTLKQTAVVKDRKLVAARLRGDHLGDDLTNAMGQDEHLQRFMEVPGKDNGIDFEGLCVSGNRLFIGLRGPVLRGWATILELELKEDKGDPTTLKLKKIGPGGRPYRKHFLHLGGLGIRDLCDQGSDILILAGPTMDLDGPVAVFRWPKALEAQEESLVFEDALTKVLDVPYGQGKEKGTDHAEGMTLFAPDGGAKPSLLVVYDCPGEHRKQGESAVEADIFPLAEPGCQRAL